MRLSLFAGTLALTVAGLSSTLAQTPAAPPQAAPSAPVIGGQNNTGNDGNVTIPRGATGADTVQTDSAAGGNAGQPSRAVPQGSAGGGSGGGGGN
ncbi:hypothetical protein ASG52_03170 [Methylobacterium sp. Leaf456]|uniref:hypothetical protein n=1 Tax=Methylobacterium sp. Leaf456 TaxID=1736382 RepID=UPI0007006186|nr:hypothetical protein [Methylobacterium sp. Leaf456]KQT57084.1 hypothetical protein ASG52_03170 [Methylobacterium sp. Leaf456]